MMTEPDINRALMKIEKGLRKYCWIQEQVHKTNVTTNRDFQRMYNGFYRVRRNDEWQMHYYEVMEQAKTGTLGFREVLKELRKRTRRLEASFASKLVATLYPDRPVIDRFVLEYFRLSLPYHYQADREMKVVEVYESLTKKYVELMSKPEARSICDMFVARYPWAIITDLKKEDLILWQTRKT
jgi:hypothetical protein